MTETVSAVLKRPFPEQVAAFRLRLANLVPTTTWTDLQGVEHDRAFMVAGAMKADLLSDLAMAVDAAVADGESLEQFRKRFRDIVATRGWHGWTGEGTKAGEAWRTRVIYRTNAATTYNAGRHAQLIEGNFPLWIYRHGDSRVPRPLHLAWNGITLPSNDTWWNSHFTPNGWGCSCYIVGARSEAGARRVGGDPSKPFNPAWRAIDPKTGEPVGISKGWGHAPGSTVAATVTQLRSKLDQLPDQPSIDLIQSWLKLNAFKEWRADPSGSWPVARVPAADARELGAGGAVADLTSEHANALGAGSPGEIQAAISGAQSSASDGAGVMVYLYRPRGGDKVSVVSVMRGPEGLIVSAFRKLSTSEAAKDPEILRLFGGLPSDG